MKDRYTKRHQLYLYKASFFFFFLQGMGHFQGCIYTTPGTIIWKFYMSSHVPQCLIQHTLPREEFSTELFTCQTQNSRRQKACVNQERSGQPTGQSKLAPGPGPCGIQSWIVSHNNLHFTQLFTSQYLIHCLQKKNPVRLVIWLTQYEN